MQTTIALSTAQKRLIQLSFSKALMRSETVTEIFFFQLLAADPSLTALFGVPKDEKRQLLFHMLSQAVSLLNDPEALLTTAQELGRRHAQLGITEKHYRLFGKVLFTSLERTLGETAFNAEVKEAWATLYDTLATAASEGI